MTIIPNITRRTRTRNIKTIQCRMQLNNQHQQRCHPPLPPLHPLQSHVHVSRSHFVRSQRFFDQTAISSASAPSSRQRASWTLICCRRRRRCQWVMWMCWVMIWIRCMLDSEWKTVRTARLTGRDTMVLIEQNDELCCWFACLLACLLDSFVDDVYRQSASCVHLIIHSLIHSFIACVVFLTAFC